MSPTLNPGERNNSDIVLVNRFYVQMFRQFKPGEVLIFRSPTDPHEYCVKRLIKRGEGYVRPRGVGRMQHVPRGYCWFEGDNPDNSIDSLDYGPIPSALVEGKVTFILWPPSRFGRVESQLPPEHMPSERLPF
eukprot:TRINITY_DN3379_c0_g1_i2.p1 TRINITY_DN3379_c0_g1~~TRINITY_DN3379_c0_g1_i2.p1  ORF type:complete len:141 (-),score=15.45 TRINITY_DN3379_c0_g1_i2:518-916(-)